MAKYQLTEQQKERYRQYSRKYRETHKEQVKAYQKSYREAMKLLKEPTKIIYIEKEKPLNNDQMERLKKINKQFMEEWGKAVISNKPIKKEQ